MKVDTPIVGKRVDLNFTFEDSGTYRCAKYSGTINSKGIFDIEKTIKGFQINEKSNSY